MSRPVDRSVAPAAGGPTAREGWIGLATPVSTPSRADALREYLLPHTIQHAVRAPFYREQFGELAGSIKSLEDLQKLPLLQKRDLVERLDDLRTIHTFPDFIMYTSGTTGAPLEVPVYRQEIDAHNDLVLREVKRLFDETDQYLTLAVLRVGHGSHVLTPEVPTIPCHINYGMDQLVTLLESEHRVNGVPTRVTNLEANVLNMRQITSELLAAGEDPSRFGLTTLSVSGWHLPPWERKFLEETWGALLLDRYGVTEVHGDSKWCHSCEHYHFDFTVIPEVLDLDTGEVIREGVGTMVLTGLYPFNQAIPKVRYVIGDLVQVGPASCGSRELAIRFLSRETDAVRVGSPWPFTLYPTAVADVLASLPDVARKVPTGFLKFRVAPAGDRGAKLEIELTYPPALFPGRVEELRVHVVHELSSKTNPNARIALSFVRPGELKTITKV